MEIKHTRFEGMNEENSGYYDFFALEDGEIVGTGSLKDIEAKIYYFGLKVIILTGLNVAESHRMKRIGTALQEAREKFAKDLGFEYVILWTDKNMWMKEWYERRGYKEFDGRKDKNYWMYKKL